MVTLKERGEQMRTPESIEKIKKLISEGSNIRQISTEMKCSSDLISRILKENSIKLQTSTREKLRQPENVEIIRKLLDECTPIKKIARIYTCTPQAIYTLISEEKLTIRELKTGAPKWSHIHTPENLEKIKDMVQCGWTTGKISLEMGCAWETIDSLIKANNWTKQL